jgi:hypothetical protein
MGETMEATILIHKAPCVSGVLLYLNLLNHKIQDLIYKKYGFRKPGLQHWLLIDKTVIIMLN